VTIRVGISGWRYAPWRGVFYPKDLPQRLELWYAAQILPTVEINGTFYSLQRPEYFRDWYDATPSAFRFAVKGPRFITHMKRLRDVQIPLANFFASGVLQLREKCGPFLWQLPPNFTYERERLEQFFKLLPRTAEAAARLARKRDSHVKNRASVAVDKDRKLRHALEVRHESFVNEDFVALLRQHRIALVIAETARRWPMMHDITADFVYMRLHGDKELYRSGYSDAALNRWARRISAWSKGSEPRDAQRTGPPAARVATRDVYCYFDNTDVKLRAPKDAGSLLRKLGQPPGDPPHYSAK
jgi:uncharacterized protein YecE (DUF72 family)